jgi:hypothetical protein
MTLSDDTITDTSAVPTSGEISAESQKNTGPNTQSLNFEGYFKDLERQLKSLGLTCYYGKNEKQIKTLEGEWYPDFCAIDDATGILVVVGEALTGHAKWASYSKDKVKNLRYTKDTQPDLVPLKITGSQGMKQKSYLFDTVTALCKTDNLVKPFMFYLHGIRTVDASEKRFLEIQEHVTNAIPSKMMKLHGVDAISALLYEIGRNKDEQKLYGSDRHELLAQIAEYLKTETAGFDDNSKGVPSPLGSVYSKLEHKEILKRMKVQRDIELEKRNIKGKGSASDFEAGIWRYGMAHFDDVVKDIEENPFATLEL